MVTDSLTNGRIHSRPSSQRPIRRTERSIFTTRARVRSSLPNPLSHQSLHSPSHLKARFMGSSVGSNRPTASDGTDGLRCYRRGAACKQVPPPQPRRAESALVVGDWKRKAAELYQGEPGTQLETVGLQVFDIDGVDVARHPRDFTSTPHTRKAFDPPPFRQAVERG